MNGKDDASKLPRSSRETRSAAAPAVGEPLDGRHYLDVTEEQQYAGKPFTPHEQDIALEESGPKKNGQKK